MRKTLPICSLLFAWLCANGALLEVVQVFAWGKMFSENARVMTVGEALSATFDPARACDLCLGVAKARDTAEKELPAQAERAGADKLLLALHSPSPLLFVPASSDWPAPLASVAPSRTEPVPVPPPRV